MIHKTGFSSIKHKIVEPFVYVVVAVAVLANSGPTQHICGTPTTTQGGTNRNATIRSTFCGTTHTP